MHATSSADRTPGDTAQADAAHSNRLAALMRSAHTRCLPAGLPYASSRVYMFNASNCNQTKQALDLVQQHMHPHLHALTHSKPACQLLHQHPDRTKQTGSLLSCYAPSHQDPSATHQLKHSGTLVAHEDAAAAYKAGACAPLCRRPGSRHQSRPSAFPQGGAHATKVHPPQPAVTIYTRPHHSAQRPSL